MTDTQNVTATDVPAPALIPPQASVATRGAGAAGTTQPQPVTDEQLHAMVSGGAATMGAAPTMLPPTAERAAGVVAAEAITATWRTNVQISALWNIDEVRNAWCYIANLGWRKLYNGRDGAFSALVTLAAQARETGRPVTAREEADGMIYEIYLW